MKNSGDIRMRGYLANLIGKTEGNALGGVIHEPAASHQTRYLLKLCLMGRWCLWFTKDLEANPTTMSLCDYNTTSNSSHY